MFLKTTVAVCLLAMMFSCITADTTTSTLSPILIITGFGGSQLNVQDSTDTECNTNGETIKLWTNRTHVESLSECFFNQMRLNYSDGVYSDAQGVNVTAGPFGSVYSLLNFSEFFPPPSNPDFVEYFVHRGYVADVNIRAAPYDWRLGADQLNQRGYYANLKQLIQQMYDDNGNTKVTLVVVSMGGPVSLYFLTQIVNQEWKDTYIHSYVTLAASWSGLNGVLPGVLTPPQMNLFLFFSTQADGQELRSIFRTIPSYYFLLNPASILNDTVVVTTPDHNYTANDYQELFTDAGYPQGFTQFSEIVKEWPAPNVPTYCYYGLGVSTPETFEYDAGFPDTQPNITNGEGDGAVNKASLEICLRWVNSGYTFNSRVFQGLHHAEIINDPETLRAVGIVVGAPEDPINGTSKLAATSQLYVITLLASILMALLANLIVDVINTQ